MVQKEVDNNTCLTIEEIYQAAFDLTRELSAWELDEKDYGNVIFYTEGVIDLAQHLVKQLAQREGSTNDE